MMASEGWRFILGRAFLFLVMNSLLVLLVDLLDLPYWWFLVPYNLFGLWLNWLVYGWTKGEIKRLSVHELRMRDRGY